VLTPTRAVADQLLAVVDELDPARVHVVAPALEEHMAAMLSGGDPAREQATADRLALPPHGYLLFVGTREPRKGLDVLLTALALPTTPDLPLLVAGPPGWGGVDVAADAAAAGLGDRVRVLGRLTDADLAVCYRRAAAVVVPSRAEGFGYPVAEAMAAGTPVVCSADPALVETGGGAVLTVPVGEADALAGALAVTVAGGQAVQQRVERGRERAATFSPLAAGQRLWDLYRGLVDAPDAG
jgi:glycosyltransferase involved in cell wall biosynthesis